MPDLNAFLDTISIPPDIKAGVVRGRSVKATIQRRSILDQLTQIFAQQGLPTSLAKWAYGAMVEGITGTELTQLLYQRPEFRARFKAMFDYQKNYPHAPAIGPQEVLAYERQAAQLMRAAGMPPGFYDHYNDFVGLIANNVSMDDLSERISQGFERVATAPRGVREAFANFFGPSGDAALAATFLDPKKAMPALRRQVGAAEAAGAGFNFGFTLGRDRALEIADNGFDFASARDRFANLSQMRPLFTETIGELAAGATDLTAEDQGAQAAFDLQGGGEAQTAIERRKKERVAEFAGSTAGTTGGTVGTRASAGLGSSRPGY